MFPSHLLCPRQHLPADDSGAEGLRGKVAALHASSPCDDDVMQVKLSQDGPGGRMDGQWGGGGGVSH